MGRSPRPNGPVEVIAKRSVGGVSLNHLIAEIDSTRTGNLSSAIRLFVLDDLKRHTSALASAPNLKE